MLLGALRCQNCNLSVDTTPKALITACNRSCTVLQFWDALARYGLQAIYSSSNYHSTSYHRATSYPKQPGNDEASVLVLDISLVWEPFHKNVFVLHAFVLFSG